MHEVDLAAPPLLPPPLPPPVARPLASPFGAATLWRWNERLALIVGGLTILLLGVISGRVLGPANSDVTSISGRITVASIAPSLEPTEAVESAAEVNPPENVVAEVDAPPAAGPEPDFEKSATPVVSAPLPPPQVESPTTSEIAAEPKSSIPSGVEAPAALVAAPASADLPIKLASVESKVASIIAPPTTLVCEPAKDFKDRKLNTALIWAESLDEASQQAEKDEKLVFLIHISGNFESPGFT